MDFHKSQAQQVGKRKEFFVAFALHTLQSPYLNMLSALSSFKGKLKTFLFAKYIS